VFLKEQNNGVENGALGGWMGGVLPLSLWERPMARRAEMRERNGRGGAWE